MAGLVANGAGPLFIIISFLQIRFYVNLLQHLQFPSMPNLSPSFV